LPLIVPPAELLNRVWLAPRAKGDPMPDTSSVAPPAMARFGLLETVEVAPAGAVNASVPAAMVVLPVYVLVPESVHFPFPTLLNATAPPPFTKAPEKALLLLRFPTSYVAVVPATLLLTITTPLPVVPALVRSPSLIVWLPVPAHSNTGALLNVPV